MRADQQQIEFVFSQPVVIPQGDGTYLLKPGKPILGRRRLTVGQAAARAGVSEDTVLRLYDSGFVEGERPSPRKTLIFEDSLDAHLQATRDREFWESTDRRQLYLSKV